MHVVVLGAGVAGVTSAYYLAREGHTVTVIDRAGTPAGGASHANAGQLSYSFCDALGAPGFVPRIPGILFGREPASQVGALTNQALLRWGLAFLRQCTAGRAHQNSVASLRLALRSAVLLAELRARVPLEFSFRPAGKLVLLGNQRDVDSARLGIEWKRQLGCSAELVEMDAARQIEPALADMRGSFSGAVYSRHDEAGDCRAFTSQLADWLQHNTPTEFRFGVTARRLITKRGRLQAVETCDGEIRPGAVVVCLGAWSTELLATANVRAAIYPVRGYSVTLPIGASAPSVSVTHLQRKLVFSRLGDRVRIAGFADFAGFSTDRDTVRVQQLLETARSIAPQAAAYESPSNYGWGGFRPMTPDSRPRTGPTAVSGLYMNTGHGMLGWTHACASGHDIARVVSGEPVRS